jgi:hypothetical protein
MKSRPINPAQLELGQQLRKGRLQRRIPEKLRRHFLAATSAQIRIDVQFELPPQRSMRVSNFQPLEQCEQRLRRGESAAILLRAQPEPA